MTLTINKEPDKERKVTMGKADKPVADYYPPGTTEPIVRPAHIPDPALKTEAKVIEDDRVADYYPPGVTEPIVRPDNIPAPEPAAPVDEPAPVEEDEEPPKKAAKKAARKK